MLGGPGVVHESTAVWTWGWFAEFDGARVKSSEWGEGPVDTNVVPSGAHVPRPQCTGIVRSKVECVARAVG